MAKKQYSDEEILSDLNYVDSIVDGRPTYGNFREHGSTYSPSSVANRFDGWDNALEKAGIDPESTAIRVTKSDIINDLQRVAEKIGESPSKRQYRKEGNYSESTAADRFESWDNAKKAASLPTAQRYIPKEDLLDDLKRVKSKLGKTPTQTEYRDHGRYSTQPIRTRFGCWNNGLREANMELNKVGWIPEPEMLHDLVDVANRHIAPPANKYRQEGKFPNRLKNKTANGKYWQACVRAGLLPHTRCPLSPSSLDSYFQTLNEFNPDESIGSRLMLFTGLNPRIIENISPDWMLDRDDPIIRVPLEYTDTGEPWVFRIPKIWVNPHTGEEMDTNLPESLDWIFDRYGEIPFKHHSTITQKVRNIASEADIDVKRRREKYARHSNSNKYESETPVVQPADLRTTYGVNLARRNVDIDTIRHRIGLDRMNRLENITDYFVWLYQFENHCHPDYEPSGTFLDSDTGKVREIESEAG